MKVVFFANTSWYLYNFRFSLARALRDDGHQVVFVAPLDKYSDKLKESGFEFVAFNFSRGGTNFVAEFLTIIRLIFLYAKLRPDLAHHFTIKSVLYGTIAAKTTGVKQVVNSVTGLGYLFSDTSLKIRVLRFLLKRIYTGILLNTQVIFQNITDRDYFLKNGWVSEEHAHLIAGSGVDVDYFSPGKEPTGTPIIVLPARMLWSKGVAEFVQAASMLKSQGVKARFALVGDVYEGNPDSVPQPTLQAWHAAGDVEWWGWQDDMLSVYRQATLVCLPSNYREGLSKTLIEAAASGKPIVTTDVPGCREVVDGGLNGVLIPHSSPQALAQVLGELLNASQLIKKMGHESRRLAEERFSTKINTGETLKVYRLMR